jgi:type IV secretory pathway VirB4 component
MIPLSAVWAGPERDEHFGAPPLLYGKTEGSTPFRFPFTSAMSATP